MCAYSVLRRGMYAINSSYRQTRVREIEAVTAMPTKQQDYLAASPLNFLWTKLVACTKLPHEKEATRGEATASLQLLPLNMHPGVCPILVPMKTSFSFRCLVSSPYGAPYSYKINSIQARNVLILSDKAAASPRVRVQLSVHATTRANPSLLIPVAPRRRRSVSSSSFYDCSPWRGITEK